MKKTICAVSALLLTLSLAACGTPAGETNQDKSASSTSSSGSPSSSQSQDAQETKTVQGIINKIDTYLVLLLDDGEYQSMDYGEGVTLDDYFEGDRVEVTYTGELGVEGVYPVFSAITKLQ